MAARLRSVCDNQQHPERSQSVYAAPEHFKAGRVQPMGVDLIGHAMTLPTGYASTTKRARFRAK